MPNVKISFTPSQKKVFIKVVDEDEVLASFKLKAKKTTLRPLARLKLLGYFTWENGGKETVLETIYDFFKS